MPNRRAEIAMTRDEVDAYVASGRVLTLATIGPDGVPDGSLRGVQLTGRVELFERVASWDHGKLA